MESCKMLSLSDSRFSEQIEEDIAALPHEERYPIIAEHIHVDSNTKTSPLSL